MEEFVEQLLEEGADPKGINKERQTALDLAQLQLLAHRMNPSNSPKITRQITERLDRVVTLLSTAKV